MHVCVCVYKSWKYEMVNGYILAINQKGDNFWRLTSEVITLSNFVHARLYMKPHHSVVIETFFVFMRWNWKVDKVRPLRRFHNWFQKRSVELFTKFLFYIFLYFSNNCSFWTIIILKCHLKQTNKKLVRLKACLRKPDEVFSTLGRFAELYTKLDAGMFAWMYQPP